MSDRCPLPSQGRPIHVAIIPVTNGMQLPTAKRGKKLCVDQTPLLDMVLAAYRADVQGQHTDPVTECPKRSHMKCARIVSRRATESVLPVTIDEEVFLYEVPLGEMTRTTTMASFLTMIDVALIYWPASGELADAAVHQHLTTHLLPLLIGMKLRGIFGFVPTGPAEQLWTSAIAAMQESSWDTETCEMGGCNTYASELHLTEAFMARINQIRRVEMTPAICKEGQDDASRPLRIAVVRRFDKIAVMVCHVLQGTVRVGDALVAVEDPSRTSSKNTVVSLRSFPDNIAVSSATAGMQVGLVVEAQLPFAQRNTKATLDAAPFLCLHLGAVLVRAEDMPVTLPCLMKATSTRVHQEGHDITLLGTGGIAIARVVGTTSGSPRVALSTTPSLDHGFFIGDLSSKKTTQQAAATLRPYQRSFEHRQGCVIGLTHSDKGTEFFPLEILAVKHRLHLHQHLWKMLADVSSATSEGAIAAALDTWNALLQPPAVGSGCSTESVQRYCSMLVDEITTMVSSSLVARMRSALNDTSHDPEGGGGLGGMRYLPSMDLLMLVSRIPVKPLAVRLWQRLALFVVEHAGAHDETVRWWSREYFPEPPATAGAPLRAMEPDRSMDLMIAMLARSARNRFWLQQVASAVGQLAEVRHAHPPVSKRAPVNISTIVHRQWMHFGIQEGCGLIRDAFGGSVRRATRGASIAQVAVPINERLAFLRDLLKSPASVTSATLYAAMQVLDYAPYVSTPLERYHKERIEHRAMESIGSILKTVVSPVIRSHFTRWLLAAGLSSTVPGDATLLGSLTFVELEVMYVMQWALQRKGIVFHGCVLQRVVHYLLLMSPRK